MNFRGIMKGIAVLATTVLLSAGAQAGGSHYGGNGGGSWGNGGGNGGGHNVPEMDAGMAPLALGLVMGVTALVADRRRKKK